MRGKKINPYRAVSYPLPYGFNGRWAAVYRWLSGRPLNGHRYTNATAFRYGTHAMDPSGKASSYHLLPGALRLLYFRAPVMAMPFYLLSGWLWPLATYLATLGLVLVATWRVQRWRKRASFRRDVTEPVSAAVSTVLSTARVVGRGHTWVAIPPSFRDDPDSRIKIKLPVEWVGKDGDKAAIVNAVSHKLAVDDLVATWTLSGGHPFVTLAVPPAPPDMTTWLSARADADAVEDGQIMVGYGARGRVEVFSLLLESPHALINGGSGAGKSTLLAWIIAQFMRRGAGVIVLDAKFVSHLWLKRVPGVHYASEAEDLHNALLWLDGELLRRARVVSSAADPDAASAALTPLLAVLEEMNSATNRLRAYWKTIKGKDDPALSPALAALANLASMGRELKINIMMAGQSLTAKSVGGPEGRENFGGRFMGRASGNAWRMLAPQIKPAPVRRAHPGRWHLVVGDSLRELQVPFVNLKSQEDMADLIEYATSGKPVPDVDAMMLGIEPVVVTPREAENPRSEGATTVRDYAMAAGIPIGTMRMRVNRAGLEPVGREGTTNLYAAVDLDRLSRAEV